MGNYRVSCLAQTPAFGQTRIALTELVSSTFVDLRPKKRNNSSTKTAQAQYVNNPGFDLSVQKRIDWCSKLLTPVFKGELPCGPVEITDGSTWIQA